MGMEKKINVERNQIQSQVINCVAESLMKDAKNINGNTKIISELGADSLDFMDIIFSLESSFGVQLEKKDFNLLTKLNLSEAEALEEGFLTLIAKEKLARYLPEIDQVEKIRPSELSRYLSIHSLVEIILDLKKI